MNSPPTRRTAGYRIHHLRNDHGTVGGRGLDLAVHGGVLIHINPERLPIVYQNLVSLSSRYVLVAEYYNPTPTEVNYRGHNERLFKRDFAGELIDEFDLNLVDYGFGTAATI